MTKDEIEFTVHLSGIQCQRMITLQDAYLLAPAYHISRYEACKIYTVISGTSSQDMLKVENEVLNK
jgi:hypothetical protein